MLEQAGGVRMEKRKDQRLPLNLPLRFFREGKEQGCIKGFTHNVSSGGIYFEAPSDEFDVHESVALRLGVPSGDVEESGMTLAGSGVICRIDKLEPDKVKGGWPEEMGVVGVAIKFKKRPTIELKSLEGTLWDS